MDKEKWCRHYNDLIEQGYSEDEASKLTDEAIADDEADYGDWLYEQWKDREFEYNEENQ